MSPVSISPLPLTWRILTTVHCPSCSQEWNFFPEQNGRFVRDAYCPNPECVQHGHTYTVEMSLDCVQIIKVVK
jgi:hypothetical protein